MKFVYQLEGNDCGPACLAMVANHYGKKYGIKEIKQFCSITRMGVSVQDIINGARSMGFEASGVKLTLAQLEEVPFPIILYWNQIHFVVLYKIKKNNLKTIYYTADPGYGKITLENDTIIKGWMGNNSKGVAIILHPTETFYSINPIKKVSSYNVEFTQLILRFIKGNKFKYTISLLLMLLGLCSSWAMPVLFQKTIDAGVSTKSMNLVWILILSQVGLFLGNFISQIISDLVLAKLNFKLSNLLKENFLFKLMKLPVSYFDTRINADTLQRLGDQAKIQNFLTWKGLELLLSGLNIIVLSIILFNMNTIIFLSFFLLSAFSIIWVGYFLKKRAIVEYSLFLRQSENSNSLYEFVMNMPEIKTNSAQEKMIENISKIQTKLNELELKSIFLNTYQSIGTNFIGKLKEIVAITLCLYLIINNKMSIGSLLSISYILGLLSSPVQNLVSYMRDAQDASISQQRINDVYLEKNEVNETKTALPKNIQSLELENVSFKYPGSFNSLVLHDVSFQIPKNKITAIVGASGSGKTTLLKLLLSFYKPTEGTILLNELSLNDINSDEWRLKCGTVLQDGHIFGGTLEQNIALAELNVDKERLLYASKIACIDEFIDRLPMGYNTRIGGVGMQLSGGQKQRILIARAVYRNPEFLFFDEATSSLDANNEKMIMENLESFFKGKTVVVIAHRLSTVKNADQIIVMNKGKITEIGTHTSLTTNKGNYYDLVKNQLELGR